MIGRFLRRYESSEARAKLLRVFWLISLGVMLIGFGVIAWRAIFPP